MDQTLEQQVQERLAELPADVRNAITSSDLGAKIHALGTKHQLHIDQVGAMETQVYLAMLGFAPLEDLPKALGEELRLAPDRAQELAQDVSRDIFGPIRESMKRFQEERARTLQKPPASGEISTTPTPAAGAFAPPISKPPLNPALAPADAVLSQKTLSLTPAPIAPAKQPAEKPIYKADPYREPV